MSPATLSMPPPPPQNLQPQRQQQGGGGDGGDCLGDEAGVIPRAVSTVLADAETRKSQGWEFVLTATYVEIYNEKIRDLLDPSKDNLQASILLLYTALCLVLCCAIMCCSSDNGISMYLGVQGFCRLCNAATCYSSVNSVNSKMYKVVCLSEFSLSPCVCVWKPHTNRSFGGRVLTSLVHLMAHSYIYVYTVQRY